MQVVDALRQQTHDKQTNHKLLFLTNISTAEECIRLWASTHSCNFIMQPAYRDLLTEATIRLAEQELTSLNTLTLNHTIQDLPDGAQHKE